MNRDRIRIGTGALAVLLTAASPVLAAGGNTTAQSAMFSNAASGNFVIDGSETWSYDKEAAEAYFYNGVQSGPIVSCTGNAANCLASNQPPAPTAPSADAARLNPLVGSNACNFWGGLPLSLAAGQTSYTRSTTLSGLNGKGNWKYEWTYEIGFADTAGPFAEKSAWTLEANETNAASVGVAGFFAGQSTLKRNNGPWTFKASHSLTEPDPVTGEPVARLVEPRYTVSDEAGSVVCGPTDIVTSLELGVDFPYSQNAGNSGTNVDQLIDNASVSDIQSGIASSRVGDVDNFVGNNTSHGERAVVDETQTARCVLQAAGAYTLNVTGTLKGLSGSAAFGFATSSSICISAGSCSLCP